MTLDELIQDEKDEARAEGRAEGFFAGMEAGIDQGKAEVLKNLGISEIEYQTILNTVSNSISGEKFEEIKNSN